jgi:hypothetical protein
MRREHQATKHTGSQDSDPVGGNDTIDDLRLAFENLDLGDQAHDLLAMISEMTNFDPVIRHWHPLHA